MSLIHESFADLPDPRASNSCHAIGDLLFIALAATLCGAASCVDYAQFATSKQRLLETVLGPFSPPSHDTFSRLFRTLDAEAFEHAFARFSKRFGEELAGVVAIDGKALRRAYEKGRAASPPLMVTAWAAETRIALAGVGPSGPGDNETEAALRAIALLDLSGAIVTADALHCTARMAEAILARGGDYALCLKGNQQVLRQEAEALLADPTVSAESVVVEETGHGRVEKRSVRVAPAPDFGAARGFPGVAAIAQIISERDGGAPHKRLFLLSKRLSAAEALMVARSHWSIENNLHWTLDVVFREDEVRARKDHAPANIALLGRLALNILNAVDDPKTPIRRRIKRCAWEDDYLLEAIGKLR